MPACKKLLDDRKIELSLDEATKELLADKGDPACGARPPKRVIRKHVQDPLAGMLLAGDVRDGSAVEIPPGEDGLTFNGRKPSAVDEDEDAGRFEDHATE